MHATIVLVEYTGHRKTLPWHHPSGKVRLCMTKMSRKFERTSYRRSFGSNIKHRVYRRAPCINVRMPNQNFIISADSKKRRGNTPVMASQQLAYPYCQGTG